MNCPLCGRDHSSEIPKGYHPLSGEPFYHSSAEMLWVVQIAEANRIQSIIAGALERIAYSLERIEEKK